MSEPAFVQWEYCTIPEEERYRLDELGLSGWELVGVGGNLDHHVLYLKRPAQSFRERVTVEQRHRYFEQLGRDPHHDPHHDAEQRPA